MDEQNFNPGPGPIEPSGPLHEEKKPNNFIKFLRNLFVLLALIIVIGFSFMVSFQLGKKLLSPANKFAEQRIKANIPEPPPSIRALQKIGLSTSTESRVLKRSTKEASFRPSHPPVSPVKKPAAGERKKTRIAAASGGHYFKLQAGLLADKGKAQELAGRLRAATCDEFIRKTAGGWRVQAGAFKTKAEAVKARQNLSGKGFQSTIIYE